MVYTDLGPPKFCYDAGLHPGVRSASSAPARGRAFGVRGEPGRWTVEGRGGGPRHDGERGRWTSRPERRPGRRSNGSSSGPGVRPGDRADPATQVRDPLGHPRAGVPTCTSSRDLVHGDERLSTVLESLGYTTGAGYQIWPNQAAFRLDLQTYIAERIDYATARWPSPTSSQEIRDRELPLEEHILAIGDAYIDYFVSREEFFLDPAVLRHGGGAAAGDHRGDEGRLRPDRLGRRAGAGCGLRAAGSTSPGGAHDGPADRHDHRPGRGLCAPSPDRSARAVGRDCRRGPPPFSVALLALVKDYVEDASSR